MKKALLQVSFLISFILNFSMQAQENQKAIDNLKTETHFLSKMAGPAKEFGGKVKSAMSTSWTSSNLLVAYKDIIEPIHLEGGSLVYFVSAAPSGKRILFITGSLMSSDNAMSVYYDDVYLSYNSGGNTVTQYLQCIGHYFSGNTSQYNYHWDLLEWSSLNSLCTWVKDSITTGECLHLDFVNDLIRWNRNPYSLAMTFLVDQDINGSIQLHFGNSTFEVEPSFDVSAETLNIAAPGYSKATFDITSNTSWTISSIESWLDILPGAGSGNATITLTADMNNSLEPRSTTLTVSSFGLASRSIVVTQAASEAYLNINNDYLYFQAADDDKYLVSVYSNLVWNLSSSVPWIVVDQLSGSMNDDFTISVEENKSISDRSGEITISANGVESKTILVEQRGADLIFDVSPREMTLPGSDTTITLDISCNATWKVTSDSKWITADPDTGTGDASVGLHFDANTDGFSRNAEIRVEAAQYVHVIIPVTQRESPFWLSVSETSLVLSDSANSSAVFNITSNTTWEVSSDQNWLFLSNTSGSGNGFIGIAALANTSDESRTATITITSNEVPEVIITVTQTGATVTGISGLSGVKVSLYPVPVTDKLLVSFSKPLSVAVLSIFNTSGIKVYSFMTTENNSEIDMSRYAPGVYFIEIKTPGYQTIRKKIVKP